MQSATYLTSTSTGSRQAFTLVELLVVIAIIGVLMAVLLVAIQSAREAARRIDCAQKIRQVGMAAVDFEANYGHFPPGYLGPLEQGPLPPDGDKYGQSLSVLVYLLTRLEQEAIENRIDINRSIKVADDPWWEDNETWSAAQVNVAIFLCPSDPMYGVSDPMYTSVHTYKKNAFQAKIQGASLPSARSLGRTNYLGVAGAMGDTGISFWDKYKGPLTNRSQNGTKHIRDGVSNTLLFGESIGGDENDGYHSFSWMGCGALPTALGLQPGGSFKFNSGHSELVNFCTAGGATRTLNIDIDPKIYRALSGMQDGDSTEEDN